MADKLDKPYLQKLKKVFIKYFEQLKIENKKPDKSIDWIWRKIRNEL